MAARVEIPLLNADPIKSGTFKKVRTLGEVKRRGVQIGKVVLIEVASDNTVLGLMQGVYEDKVLKKSALRHDPADKLETKLYHDRADLHGVAKFYGVWQDSSSYHFVSQFCELKDIMEFTNFTEDGVSVLKEPKPFIKKLVQAVAELHVKGYAHLGLSDEASILVTREEGVLIPKLANLGEISSVTRQHIRWPTDMPGTLESLPPELYGRDVPDYDLTKVDGYQLAMLLLKIFFGYWLRPREFPAAWVIPSSRASTPWLRNLLEHMQWKDCVPDVQAASCLLDLLEQMLHPNPDQRLTVREALEHPYLNGQSSSHTDLEVEEVRRYDPICGGELVTYQQLCVNLRDQDLTVKQLREYWDTLKAQGGLTEEEAALQRALQVSPEPKNAGLTAAGQAETPEKPSCLAGLSNSWQQRAATSSSDVAVHGAPGAFSWETCPHGKQRAWSQGDPMQPVKFANEAPTPSSTSAGASPSPFPRSSSSSSTAAPTPSSTFASQGFSFLIEEPADQHWWWPARTH